MGAYLTEHYEFEDKRENPDYASWQEDAKLFYRQKAKCELISAETFADYTALLSDPDYAVFISAKNAAGLEFDTEAIETLNQNLGLNCRLDERGDLPYLAVIDAGSVIYETDMDLQTAADEINADETQLSVDGISISMSSPGGLADQSASILVRGTEFSLDYDGFNIAVYDKVLGEMFELSAADLANGLPLVRK
jgi:hypothetical protein